MKYVFIINPTSGKRLYQEIVAKEIRQYFEGKDDEYIIHYTTCRGDAKAYSRSLAMSGENVRIYACGGEGTSFEVLNGVHGYDNVSLGVIPCGSANDFITYFADKELFLDIASQVDGETINLDIIKAGDFYALNSCSVGLDAMSADNMTKFKKWPLVTGSMAYVLGVVYTLFGKISNNLKIKIDNGLKIINEKILLAVVANAPYYGGGFYPTPGAMPYDGKLNYSVITPVSRPRIVSLLKKYRLGTHINYDFCRHGECRKISISAEKPLPFNMDGEIVYAKDIDFEIIPSACKFILPKTVYSVWNERANKFKKTAESTMS